MNSTELLCFGMRNFRVRRFCILISITEPGNNLTPNDELMIKSRISARRDFRNLKCFLSGLVKKKFN
jgi:hypothetical protein